MDIDELQHRKMELEVRIADKVAQEVAQFRRDTGYSPSSLDIDMIDSTRMGDTKHDYMVGSCRATITL